MITHLKKFARSICAQLGYEVYRVTPEEDVYQRRGRHLLRLARQNGIDALVDVGANCGQYSGALRQLGFDGTIISLEPAAAPFEQLVDRCSRDPAWRCINSAAGAVDGPGTLQIAGNSESSSLLPMLDLHVAAYAESAYVGQQHVRVLRLDSILPTMLPEANRLMMKLDVQGYELNALQGAVASLPRVWLIDVELSLAPLYAGQASFTEVVGFLEENGFTPVSFENGFTDPRSGHALQVDAVFLRSPTRPAGP